MSLNDLVTTQPEETGTTPVETESEMINKNEEQASETSVNSESNSDHIDGDFVKQEEALKDRTQKRFDTLLGSNKELEARAIRAEAQLEASEKYSQAQQDKTLKDYPLDVLTRFVADNQGDDEMVAQVAEAKEIIIEKRIDAKVDALAEKQNATTNKQKGEQLTNAIIGNISGDRLRDTSSEYFATANQYLYDLGQPDYANLNKDQLIASLLAERDFQMKQQNGPTMNDRVKNNQNNNIKANTRQSSGGGSDLASYLESTDGRLTRSSISKRGSTNEAIRKLKMFDDT